MGSSIWKTLVAGLLALGFAASSHANFSGAYAPANWTPSNGPGGTGGTTFTHTADSLSFLGGDSGPCNVPDPALNRGDCRVNLTITIPLAGTLSFDWSHTNNDLGGAFEYFGYELNAVETNLAEASASGSESFPVAAGDVFSFYYDCWDCQFGPGGSTVRGFVGPTATEPPPPGVPEPGTLLLSGAALLGFGLARAKRRALAA